MTAFFLDTSAIVKRYLPEIGTTWVRGLCDPEASNSISVCDLTLVEVAAALAARHRANGGISQRARDVGLRLFRRHYTTEYRVVPLSRTILNEAVDLTQRHRLRGYDAIRLATALAADAALTAAGQAGLTFVSADHDLVAAANTEGLLSDDPHQHP